MSSLEKRYNALKHNPNFEKLNVEFLIITLAENIEYIILVLTALALLGLTSFDLDPTHFPGLSLKGEWAYLQAIDYNPIKLYMHFIWAFFEVTYGFALGFFNTVKTKSYTALAVVFIMVNIWLAYSKLKYGYDKRSSRQHNVFLHMMKNYLFSSTLIERSLWTLFFIDLMVFLTSPSKGEIYFLLLLYGLILSVKLVPWISRWIVSLSKSIQKSFIGNKKVQLGVAVLDIVLVYFDSSSVFTLLAMVITYNLVAQLVFKILKGAKLALKIMYYVFNIGTFIFFGSLIIIYLMSYAVVLMVQSPLIAIYYYKKRKFLPAWMMEIVNGCFIAFFCYKIFF